MSSAVSLPEVFLLLLDRGFEGNKFHLSKCTVIALNLSDLNLFQPGTYTPTTNTGTSIGLDCLWRVSGCQASSRSSTGSASYSASAVNLP